MASARAAIKCNSCNGKVDRYDDYISCRGECNSNFHIRCVNLSIEEYSKMRDEGDIKVWLRSACKEEIISNNDSREEREAVK